jgi:hypothetical protein
MATAPPARSDSLSIPRLVVRSRKRRHGPPLPAQAPPPPLVIELPPEIAVRVSNQLVLDEYEWVAGAPMELEWCFWFWNEPRPRGRVIVPP